MSDGGAYIAGAAAGGGELESDLADVGRLPLPELFDPDDTALGNAMRRVLADLDERAVRYAAFGNAP
jgi:FXSXX-COOH protein